MTKKNKPRVWSGDDILGWDVKLVKDTEYKASVGWLIVGPSGSPMPASAFEVALWGKCMRLQKEITRLRALLAVKKEIKNE